MKAGRNTKLTPELVRQFCKFVENGNTNVDACNLLEISTSSFYDWKAKGKRQARGIHRDFVDELEKSRRRYKMRRREIVNRAALGDTVTTKVKRRKLRNGDVVTMTTTETVPPDWRQAARELERAFPEQFGSSSRRIRKDQKRQVTVEIINHLDEVSVEADDE